MNELRFISTADVYVDDQLTAQLIRDGNLIRFEYLPSATQAVATTLPLSEQPVLTANGAVPPFFAGLLPEGRRLSALRAHAKTSADDELTLLLAVGGDLVGNVSIFPHGQDPEQSRALIDRMDNEPIDFSAALSSAGIVDPVSIAGVQDKASLRTIAIPMGSDAILKVTPPEYPQLVENEAALLDLAESAGAFDVVQHEVQHDVIGRSGLVVHRFDRDFSDPRSPRKLAVEDATQLLNVHPGQKYSVSFEDVTSAILNVVDSPLIALRSIAYQLAFSWLTGNGDLHAKNLSVVRSSSTGLFELSPAYDLPSTLIYGDKTLALQVAGATDGLSLKKFLGFAESMGLPLKAAEKIAEHTLHITRDVPELLIDTLELNPRQERDLRRVISRRRHMWGE